MIPTQTGACAGAGAGGSVIKQIQAGHVRRFTSHIGIYHGASLGKVAKARWSTDPSV